MAGKTKPDDLAACHRSRASVIREKDRRKSDQCVDIAENGLRSLKSSESIGGRDKHTGSPSQKVSCFTATI